MEIKVLQKHIKNGCPKSSNKCPVALAFLHNKEAEVISVCVYPKYTRGYKRISYWEATVCIQGQSPKAIRLPKRVGQKIIHYDRTGELDPFTFKVDL